jgi:hypothetical protein
MYLHICSLFNGVDSESNHAASNHRMTGNSKAIAAELQALFRHLVEEMRKTVKRFPSEELVFWSRLELVNPKCKIPLETACSVTRTTK